MEKRPPREISPGILISSSLEIEIEIEKEKVFVCLEREIGIEIEKEREREIERDNVLLPVHAWGRERPERYLQGYELALVNKIFKFQISMDISKYLYNIFIVLL